MQEYDFEIIYKPAKTNVIADALSRRPDLQVNTITQALADQNLLDIVKKEYSNDSDFGEIFKLLQNKSKSIPAHLRKKIQQYKLEDGCLIYIAGEQS